MFLVYRIAFFLVGLGLGQLLMEKYMYLFMESEAQILPIWAFVFSGLLGFIIATRGKRDAQHKNFNRSEPWLLMGLLANASHWMFVNTETSFQIAIVVSPLVVWYIIANWRDFHGEPLGSRKASKI